MNYTQWQETVPDTIRNDSVWKMTVYRLALFLGALAWTDVTNWCKDRRSLGISDQLYRAAGSISTNLAEGYSRGTGKDRARFYEYSLGSARGTRDWYFKGRHVLGETVTSHRFQIAAEIIRLILTMIPQQRGYALKEDEAPFETEMLSVEFPPIVTLLNHISTDK